MLGHSIAEYTAIRTRSSRKRDGSWNQHGPEWLCLCACVCVSAERNAAGKCHENRFQQNMFTVCASAFDYVCVCVCAYLCICVGYTLSSEIEFSLSLTVNRIGRETLFCREREWYRCCCFESVPVVLFLFRLMCVRCSCKQSWSKRWPRHNSSKVNYRNKVEHFVFRYSGIRMLELDVLISSEMKWKKEKKNERNRISSTIFVHIFC